MQSSGLDRYTQMLRLLCPACYLAPRCRTTQPQKLSRLQTPDHAVNMTERLSRKFMGTCSPTNPLSDNDKKAVDCDRILLSPLPEKLHGCARVYAQIQSVYPTTTTRTTTEMKISRSFISGTFVNLPRHRNAVITVGSTRHCASASVGVPSSELSFQVFF